MMKMINKNKMFQKKYFKNVFNNTLYTKTRNIRLFNSVFIKEPRNFNINRLSLINRKYILGINSKNCEYIEYIK